MHRIACESGLLSKGADWIGAHGQKIYEDCYDENGQFDENMCSYEDWKTFEDYYTCDIFAENRPDFLMMSGTSDDTIPYNGGMPNPPQSYGRQYISELAECDYDGLEISQQWSDTDFCMTNAECDTSLV